MLVKCENLFTLQLVSFFLVTEISVSKAVLVESASSNRNIATSPDFSGQIQTRHTSTSGIRRFVSTPNNIVASPLILESHGVVPLSVPLPVQTSGFAVAPTVLPTNGGSLERLATAVHANPVLAALLISSLLSLNNRPKPVAYNTAEHLPPDPYIALLLSHYGRYLPRAAISGQGLYGYTAANNIHNTRPFGSYKITEDSR